MELTIKEIKPLIKYIISNNEKLEAAGKDPVALNIEGDAGLGKSAIVEQIAKELDYNYVKLALAEITETGDLCGFPVCLHYCCNDNGDCDWIAPELIDSYVKAGYHITSETKMSYALPEWYKSIDPSKGTILLLDDYTRALSNILQACYELVYKQELWSFHLPPKTTIILTTNPENGDYNVNNIDEAGKTRMLNFNLKWDVDSWAEYAESANLDGRCINFLLAYADELFKNDGTHSHIMNARSYTMFANVIGGIPNWGDSSSLATILQIASGCFNDEDDIVGSLFTTFLANKLDKLISSEDMLFGDWDKVSKRMEECVYENGEYKNTVGSILHTRFCNKASDYLKSKGSKGDVVVNRILEIIDNDEMLFSEDLLFDVIRKCYEASPSKMKQLILNNKTNKVLTTYEV